MVETQKPTLLLVGWESYQWVSMQEKELKQLLDIVEIRFAQFNTSALDEIAKVHYKEKRQVDFLLFKRNFMYVQPEKTSLIASFFQNYTHFFDVIFGMIESDSDEIRNTVNPIETFIINNDWDCLEQIIKNRLVKKQADIEKKIN